MIHLGRNNSRWREAEIILAAVAAHLNVPVGAIAGDLRHWEVARARRVAMYLLRTLTHASYPAIARALDRDHSTVITGVRKVTAEMATDPMMRAVVLETSQAAQMSLAARGLWSSGATH